MFLGSSCCNIAENSTFARPLDFACRLNPSFHAFAEACATETLGIYFHAEIISKIVTDDAGRKCCEDYLQVIELRVQAKPEGFPLTNYGHAFIATPNMAYGAYANLDSSLGA